MIHVENYEEEHGLRRGSSQITVVDPYHPALQQRNQQSQQIQEQPDQSQLQQYGVSSRKSSLVDNYSRNASLEQYQSFEDQYSPYTQRPRNSEPQVPPARRLSLRLSPGSEACIPPLTISPGSPEPRKSEPTAEVDIIGISKIPDERHINFNQEEAIKEPKPHITAQQRWLWAYNKIIMQLDVSTIIIYYENISPYINIL